VLELRDAALPSPKAGELRVRVHAAGINFADIMARLGLYPDAPPLPAVVGYEVAGEVEALGAGVSNFKLGDRVVSLTRFGGYSETLCVPAQTVTAMPLGLSFETAAAIPVNYLTAWLMLIQLGNLQPRDRVLIHGVAGGVGQAALQICRWKSAEVLGTASSSKHARLLASGVRHCIDYRKQDFEAETMRLTGGAGVDIVLDAVGGHSFKKSYRCLAPLGRLFMFGMSSLATRPKRSLMSVASAILSTPFFHPLPLMSSNKGVFGINLGHLWERSENLGKMLQTIVRLTGEGVFSPVIDRSFRFSEAAEAHDYIQARKNFGKVVLIP